MRFHGAEAWTQPYARKYTGRRLWRPAEKLESWLDEGSDVYAYFNNDHHGYAVEDATWLAARLRRAQPAQV